MAASLRTKTLSGGLALVMSLAVPFTAKEEGLRTAAYLDAVNVPTICYGETEGVKMGDRMTEEDCGTLFYIRLGMFAWAVQTAVKTEMPPEVHAALTSWAYNVGLGAMRKSTVVRLANAGDLRGACNGLLAWKFAGGKPILEKRRQRERALCLKGVQA